MKFNELKNRIDELKKVGDVTAEERMNLMENSIILQDAVMYLQEDLNEIPDKIEE